MAKKKSTEKKRVLYFDDEPFISSALVQNLNLFKWNVVLVSTIDDLFKELKTHQYGILMLDLMVPIPNKENKYVSFSAKEIDGMNMGINVGVVIAKKVWKELNKNIPILFLSARRNPIPEDPELNNYKCDYLRKPQLVRVVDEKLTELLNQ